MEDEFDKLINEIENKELDITEENKDLITPNATEEDELMQSVVDMSIDDRKKADDLYNVFLPDVSTGRDRSSASKETMAKALELKINSAKNIIELLKLKKGSEKNNVGVFFGDTLSSKKTGINLDNIKNNL